MYKRCVANTGLCRRTEKKPESVKGGQERDCTSNSLMLFDVTYRPMPMGIKMSPMTKKAGSTLPAVRMGCQAGSLCCLNAVLSGFLFFERPVPLEAPEWCPSSSLAL